MGLYYEFIKTEKLNSYRILGSNIFVKEDNDSDMTAYNEGCLKPLKLDRTDYKRIEKLFKNKGVMTFESHFFKEKSENFDMVEVDFERIEGIEVEMDEKSVRFSRPRLGCVLFHHQGKSQVKNIQL